MEPKLASPTRHFFIDWLRIAAFALLVAYHVGMVFVPWDYHVKSATTYSQLEPWMRLSSPWRMGLLFVISGVATGSMLARPGLARERSRRLLLPLVFGMLVVVPPQPYFEVVQKLGFSAGFVAFLGHYFRADHGFCPDGRCIALPTWNHLWFLPYLWCYTLLLLGARRVLPTAVKTRVEREFAALDGWRLIALPALLLGAARVALYARFGSTHALVDDAYNHACYVPLFVFGVVAARRSELLGRMEALRWPALWLAVASWLAMNMSSTWAAGHATLPPAALAAARSAFGCMQWAGIVAAFGFARRHLNRDHRWRAALSEAVFPLYILHQTIIVAGAFAMRGLGWPEPVQAPLLVMLTFAAGLAGWRLARRVPLLRPWLGMSATRSPASTLPGRVTGQATAAPSA